MIITIVSSKGGAGKTTLTANSAALLADSGYRVLMVDADIQPALSSYFGIREKANHGLTALVTRGSVENAISETAIEGLDLVYSDDPDGALGPFILNAADGRARIKFALEETRDRYDMILIDTQGAVGPLQETAVLAADLLVSPLPPDAVSAREFRRGTLRILKELVPMGRLGLPVAPLFALIYRMDHTLDARAIAEQAQRLADEGQIDLFQTRIPKRVAFQESATWRTPVHRLDSQRRGPSPCAREIMEAFTQELWAKALAVLDRAAPGRASRDAASGREAPLQ